MNQTPYNSLLSKTSYDRKFGQRSVDPRMLEKSRIELSSVPTKQNKLNFLNECDQVTLQLLQDKINEFKSITKKRDEALIQLNADMQAYIIKKAKIESDIIINNENKSNEMDKVKNADVDLHNLKQKVADKSNFIEEIKTENTILLRQQEREKRLQIEMKNTNLKMIKDLEEIIQTAILDIQIQNKEIEKSKKLITEFQDKEKKYTLEQGLLNTQNDNLTGELNEKKSQQQKKLQSTIEIQVQNKNQSNLNQVLKQIDEHKDKIEMDIEFKQVLTGKIDSLKNKQKSIQEILNEYKSEADSNLDQQIKLKNGKTINHKRRISADEIDSVKKNISNIGLDIEMELARKDDIQQKIKYLRELREDKECYKSYFLESLQTAGVREKQIQRHWIEENRYKIQFLKQKIDKLKNQNGEYSKMAQKFDDDSLKKNSKKQ